MMDQGPVRLAQCAEKPNRNNEISDLVTDSRADYDAIAMILVPITTLAVDHSTASKCFPIASGGGRIGLFSIHSVLEISLGLRGP